MNIAENLKSLFKKSAPRRREPRLRVRSAATVNGVGGRLFDLSLRGCGFYAGLAAPHLEKRVMIELVLRKGQKFKIKGNIVSRDDEGIVFGIVFTQVSDDALDAIEALLSQAKVRPDNVESGVEE